jgi:chemotaxis protein CheX
MEAKTFITAEQMTLKPESAGVDLFQAVVQATTEVFDTMVLMDISAGRPLTERTEKFIQSISGIVGLSGQRRGMLAVHCPVPVALGIARALLGEECEDVNEDVKDAIGEIVNMVAGGVKTLLQEAGEILELAVPSIIAGQSYAVNLLSQADWLMVPFETQLGQFLVEFKLARQT